MLKRENYTSEHIDALRKQTGADPSILERTVFAFGLLEALCRVKIPFILCDIRTHSRHERKQQLPRR